tara:strand:+ start:176 stop:784 length:609 start_codon:yes stop_codon:yes gene_type:complete
MEKVIEEPIEKNEDNEEKIDTLVEEEEPMEKPKTGRHHRTPAQLESLKKAQQTRRENIAKRKKELEELGKSVIKGKKKTKSQTIDDDDDDDEDYIPSPVVKKKKSRKPKIILEESSDDDNEIVISRRRRKHKQEVCLDTQMKEVRKQIQEQEDKLKEEEEEEEEEVEKPKPKPKPKPNKEKDNVVPPEQYFSNRDILRAYGL